MRSLKKREAETSRSFLEKIRETMFERQIVCVKLDESRDFLVKNLIEFIENLILVQIER